MAEEKKGNGLVAREGSGAKGYCFYSMTGSLNVLATKGESIKKEASIVDWRIGGWKRLLKGDEQQEYNFGRTSKCHVVNPLFF